NAPFEYRFIAPALKPGTTNFTLRAKATDTGGNSTSTPTLVVNLLPDTTPPRVGRVIPETGSVVDSASAVYLYFTEAIQATTVNSETLQLIYAGPDAKLGTADDVV